MKNHVKLYDLTGKLDLRDERAISEALYRTGVYSQTHTFPIASLQFELTSHCNMFCKHCYNNSGIKNVAPDAMTPEKWIIFSKYLVAHGGIYECLLSGGEPLLLGKNLFKIMDILHNDGTCFTLITNGYLITEEVAKKLKKYNYHRFQVSIDGANAEYHDLFRQKRGSWENAVNAALAIVRNEIPLKIAHCVTPYNIHDIDDMCDLAYSLGASAITVGELCLSGRVGQNQDLLLSDNQRNILGQKVLENAYKYQGRMRVKTSNRVRFGLEQHQKRPNSGAIIRPNGDIKIDGMAPFVIGNVITDDFAEVWTRKLDSSWKHPKVKEYIASFSDDDRNYTFINYAENDIYI